MILCNVVASVILYLHDYAKNIYSVFIKSFLIAFYIFDLLCNDDDLVFSECDSTF